MLEKLKLPVLAIKDPNLVVFPGLFSEVNIGRAVSMDAIAAAQSAGTNIIVAYQKNPELDSPVNKDIYGICIEAEIRSISKDESGNKLTAVLYGGRRGALKTFGKAPSDTYYHGVIEILEEETGPVLEEVLNIYRELRDIVSQHIKTVKLETSNSPETMEQLSALVDNIAGQLPIIGRHKLKLLRTKEVVRRLQLTLDFCAKIAKHEPIVLTAEPPPENEKDQSEQLDADPTVNYFLKLIRDSKIEGEALKVAQQELKRLKITQPTSSEYHVIYGYLDTLLNLPWNKKTEDKLDIHEAREQLNADHYGLEKPKERILEFLAVKKLIPNKKGSILCFAGSPGVGKTSIGKSIAKAMGRQFIRISLGGIDDEAEIRGHRKTYVGSMPGKIMQMIKRVGVKNPVFMLDELDKVCRSMRGDPAAALLEVLDPEQNNAFVDNYLGVPFDLSEVMFIATVNDIHPIPPALRDRMEIIDLPGYSTYDKIKIAQDYLIIKQKEENGLKEQNITISTNALEKIIEEYTSEAGVRSLERECGTIMRKVAVAVAEGAKVPTSIKVDMVSKYLGPPKMFGDKALEEPEVGISTGLSWSPYGGALLFVEASLVPGKGEVYLTGNLGKVLSESTQAALTWIKSNADVLGIEPGKIEKHNIHLHFPAGAVPKDGPSAGIAITTAMISALTGKPVRNDVAMTGEITLRGRVLPIGGLREKVMSAQRAGIKKVLFPSRNKYNLDEIPEEIRKGIELVPVSGLKEALEHLFINTIKSLNNDELIQSEKETLIN